MNTKIKQRKKAASFSNAQPQQQQQQQQQQPSSSLPSSIITPTIKHEIMLELSQNKSTADEFAALTIKEKCLLENIGTEGLENNQTITYPSSNITNSKQSHSYCPCVAFEKFDYLRNELLQQKCNSLNETQSYLLQRLDMFTQITNNSSTFNNIGLDSTDIDTLFQLKQIRFIQNPYPVWEQKYKGLKPYEVGWNVFKTRDQFENLLNSPKLLIMAQGYGCYFRNCESFVSYQDYTHVGKVPLHEREMLVEQLIELYGF